METAGPATWTSSSLLRLLGFYVLYRLSRALYNISPLHPLSHVPGPKLAAATFLYEAWFDLIQGGRYTREIQRMHEIYGSLHFLSFSLSPSLLQLPNT